MYPADKKRQNEVVLTLVRRHDVDDIIYTYETTKDNMDLNDVRIIICLRKSEVSVKGFKFMYAMLLSNYARPT